MCYKFIDMGDSSMLGKEIGLLNDRDLEKVVGTYVGLACLGRIYHGTIKRLETYWEHVGTVVNCYGEWQDQYEKKTREVEEPVYSYVYESADLYEKAHILFTHNIWSRDTYVDTINMCKMSREAAKQQLRECLLELGMIDTVCN